MENTSSALELSIHRIGRELAKQSAGLSPTVFDPGWWSKTLLDWGMKDEGFKVRLFRFIDVLPCLETDAQVARLMEEYFGGTDDVALPLQWGLRAISKTSLGSRLSAKSLRRQIHQMARTFIAGASITDALPDLLRLWKEGRGFSVDLLGETTVTEKEADRYRDRCLEALRLLGKATVSWPAASVPEQGRMGLVPRVNLSVKLSALYSQLDPIDPEGSFHAVAARLRPLLGLAMTMPAALTFDMEQAELKDLTLMIFMRLLSEDAYRSYAHGGIAIQAYLKESATDIDALLQWVRRRGAPISIRLVKGAYWDSDTIRYQQRGWPVPVFQSKPETDSNYEALTRTLIQHADLIMPVLGTHNLRSLAHAEAAAQAAGLKPEAYEYQMIFGMAEPLQAAVVKAGRRVRIYTPVGELLPGMAYLVRRLLENTSNESFLRREYAESEPLDLLLAPPQPDTLQPASSEYQPDNLTLHGDAVPDQFVNEPHAEFSQVSSRAAMTKAITEVRGQLGRTLSYRVPSDISPSGPELVSLNPSRPSEMVGRLRSFEPADVAGLVQAVLPKLALWSATAPDRRADILVKAAATMRRRRFELSAWEIFETGKSWREADADVTEAIDFLEFYAREMRRLGHPRRLGQEPGELNHLMFFPRGLVVVIPP
ncbi:MAG TPA: proline dehydrogenase family protein, partial [Candidatus Binatia bacterium]|nr:proline dehydrogenase family protein [Candidatus Binatia bacterium]